MTWLAIEKKTQKNYLIKPLRTRVDTVSHKRKSSTYFSNKDNKDSDIQYRTNFTTSNLPRPVFYIKFW